MLSIYLFNSSIHVPSEIPSHSKQDKSKGWKTTSFLLCKIQSHHLISTSKTKNQLTSVVYSDCKSSCFGACGLRQAPTSLITLFLQKNNLNFKLRQLKIKLDNFIYFYKETCLHHNKAPNLTEQLLLLKNFCSTTQSTWEDSESSRSAWSMKQVPRQLELLHRETLSHKNKTKI